MSTQSYQADFTLRCKPSDPTDTRNVAVLWAGPLIIGLHHNEAVELHRQLDKILRGDDGNIVSKPLLVTEQPLAQWEKYLLAKEGL